MPVLMPNDLLVGDLLPMVDHAAVESFPFQCMAPRSAPAANDDVQSGDGKASPAGQSTLEGNVASYLMSSACLPLNHQTHIAPGMMPGTMPVEELYDGGDGGPPESPERPLGNWIDQNGFVHDPDGKLVLAMDGKPVQIAMPRSNSYGDGLCCRRMEYGGVTRRSRLLHGVRVDAEGMDSKEPMSASLALAAEVANEKARQDAESAAYAAAFQASAELEARQAAYVAAELASPNAHAERARAVSDPSSPAFNPASPHYDPGTYNLTLAIHQKRAASGSASAPASDAQVEAPAAESPKPYPVEAAKSVALEVQEELQAQLARDHAAAERQAATAARQKAAAAREQRQLSGDALVSDRVVVM